MSVIITILKTIKYTTMITAAAFLAYFMLFLQTGNLSDEVSLPVWMIFALSIAVCAEQIQYFGLLIKQKTEAQSQTIIRELT